jgi:hypothetical protein
VVCLSAGLAGWRRSADRTRLQANSLLTGNLTGNFATSGPEDRISEQETAVLQRFLSQFPTKLNRENIFENRELKNQEQGIKLQKWITGNFFEAPSPSLIPN